MKISLIAAFGILSQSAALVGYSWLALAWPDSAAKYLGFVVLVAGSVMAVWLLHRLPTRQAVLGLAVLSLAAPLVPMTAYAKAREILDFPADAAAYIARGFAMAFACYAVVWLVFTALHRRSCRAGR